MKAAEISALVTMTCPTPAAGPFDEESLTEIGWHQRRGRFGNDSAASNGVVMSVAACATVGGSGNSWAKVVTPASLIPHGMIWSKAARSAETLSEKPCRVV